MPIGFICQFTECHFQVTGFDVEDLLVDNYYYFDKSTKRNNELVEYCNFCDGVQADT